MKLVRTFSMILALASASTAYAQTPPAKAPAPAPTEKKAPDKPAAKEELSAADAAKAEKFFNEFYDAVMKNQDACPKMATAINTLLDKNEAWLKPMIASGKDMPQATKDRLQKKQSDMTSGMMKCKDDKGIQAAMQRFLALGANAKKKDAPPPPPAAPPAKK